MSDRAYRGGERVVEVEREDALDDGLADELAIGRRPRTATLRQAIYRHAITAHDAERERGSRAAALVAAAIGGGAPLPIVVRRRLEALLETDLYGVRVHTGGAAHAAAEAIGARAFAHGDDLVFADGAFAPGTADGDRLLAHEATHAARHRGAPGVTADAHAEAEADAFAGAYASLGRALDPAHLDAVRGLLRSIGLRVDADDEARLAIQYGRSWSFTSWTLGGDRRLASQQLAGLVEHARSHQCTDACAHPPRAGALDDATRATVERATGVALGEVHVEHDAPLPGGRLGETTGNVIRLAPQASGDDALAREVRVHEAVHVAQGRLPHADDAGAPAADRTAAVELEAHTATDAALRGDAQPLAAKADPGAPYAFDLSDLGLDPRAFLREHFPSMAALLDGGFPAMLQSLGDSAGAAFQSTLDRFGMGDLQSGFDSITKSFKPGGLAFGLLNGCCECLDHALHDLLQSVQGALNSDTGQKIRHWIEAAQDAENDGILATLTDFFDSLHKYGGKLLSMIESADSAIGHSPAWKYIAPLFGLDPSLTPIEGIKKKLSDLWDGVKKAVEAIKNGIAALWAKIKQNSVVAAVLKFVDDCGKLYGAIQKVREAKSRDPQVWLGILAKELKGTIFESLVSKLQSGYTGAIAFKNAAVAWFDSILDEYPALAAIWNTTVPILNAIGRAIQSLAQRIQAAITAIKKAISDAIDELSKALQDLWNAIEPYVSFVVGLGIAIAMTFAGDIFAIPRFVMGQLWLHVLPHCYKEALTNFLLDLFIMLVEWFPAKHPIMILLRSAGLSFLRTIRAASAEQKIGAMDTIAKVMSNDVEVIAGFFVGVVKGLWNSSLGFIVQAAIFPFQMAWDVLSTIGEKLGALAGMAFGVVFDGASWIVNAMATAKPHGGDAPSPGANPDPNAAQPGQPEGGDQPPQQPVSTTVDVGPTVDGGGADAPAAGSSAAPPASGASAPGGAAPAPGGGAAPAGGAPAPASPDQPAPAPGGGAPAPGGAAPAPGGGGDSIFEGMPAFPHMPPMSELMDHVFNKGVSREEIEEMFKKFNMAMDTWGTKLGAEGANKLLPYLNARSAPYDLGVIIGEVVGWLAGEIIMLVFTDGIENAIAKFMEGAMDGARIIAKIGEYFPKLAEWLMDMRKLIAPLIEAVEKIAAKAKEFLQKVMKWIEEMIAWVKRQMERILKWLEETFGELGKLIRKGWNWLVKHEKEGELLIEAKTTAKQAWEELVVLTAGHALPDSKVQGMLREVQVLHTPDVHIQLSLYHEGSVDGISWWGVRSVASKEGKSETGHSGMGAVLTPETGGGIYFSTHEFLATKVRHEGVIETAYLELEKVANIGAGMEGLTAAYEQKKAAAEAAQVTGQREVVSGCKFTITLEPLSSPDVQGKQHFSDTTFLIAPNATKKKKKVHIVPDTDLEKLEKEIHKAETEYMEGSTLVTAETTWAREQLAACGANPEVATYRTGVETHGTQAEALRLRAERNEADIIKAREWYIHADHAAGVHIFQNEIIPRCEAVKADAVKLKEQRPKGDWDTDYVELIAGKLMLKATYWDIRRTFYGKEYNTDAKGRIKKAMQTKTIGGELYWFFAGPPLSPRGDQWWKVEDSKEMPTAAHNDPSVKDHWELHNGNGMAQPPRTAFFNFSGKAIVLEPKTYNSAKGALEDAMTKEVKKTFRGRS